ncbi:TIGR02679 domain-containing protein [Virgibacillus siamensis]|uniref:TIGR02679 domain-containing protein n=1 Tax=Virgibacillus siamensis TaxID=480071 RepID=A0ABN1FFX0_9BACI
MEKQLQEAAAFFKNEPAYQKLFHGFRKKYESLGRIGGTVPTKKFTDAELEVIAAFFGSAPGQMRKRNSISITAFKNQLAQTRFGDVNMKDLLDVYFGQTIISRKEQHVVKEARVNELFKVLQERYPVLTFWFTFLHGESTEGRWVRVLAEKEPAKLAAMMENLAAAFTNLPDEPERLPMFSQRITGDPHAFDLHTDLGRLLLSVMAINQDMSVPSTTETTNELLQHFHIYRDDLLNFVTCSGLTAVKNGAPHPVWKAAVEENTVQIVPLRELTSLERVHPANGVDVWAVENSGVCAALLDHQPDAPIICTNGQFTLAALLLLDRLTATGSIVHYAGDFDPEGLGMVQRLLKRYPQGQIQPWHMNQAGYVESNPVKELSAERLEKLKRITHPELIEVARKMQEVGKAGYQEALVERMIRDM